MSLPPGPAAEPRMQVSRRLMRSARALETCENSNNAVQKGKLQVRRFEWLENASWNESRIGRTYELNPLYTIGGLRMVEGMETGKSDFARTSSQHT